MWVYCLAISRELTEDEFLALNGTLAQGAAERVARIAHRESAVRALLAETLTRSVLAQHAGGAPSDLKFSVGAHGKPELLSSPWHYNITHSGDWVVCAVSDSQPVGIDVERVRDANLAVARRFHLRELERVTEAPLPERDGVFFEIWTTKESFLKAVGIGISVALNSFWADDETRTIRIDDPAPFAKLGLDIESGWCFDPLPLDDGGYRLTACSREREQHQRRTVDIDEMIRRWCG